MPHSHGHHNPVCTCTIQVKRVSIAQTAGAMLCIVHCFASWCFLFAFSTTPALGLRAHGLGGRLRSPGPTLRLCAGPPQVPVTGGGGACPGPAPKGGGVPHARHTPSKGPGNPQTKVVGQGPQPLGPCLVARVYEQGRRMPGGRRALVAGPRGSLVRGMRRQKGGVGTCGRPSEGGGVPQTNTPPPP